MEVWHNEHPFGLEFFFVLGEVDQFFEFGREQRHVAVYLVVLGFQLQHISIHDRHCTQTILLRLPDQIIPELDNIIPKVNMPINHSKIR